MTFFIGNAIKEGAEKALEIWANEERPVHLDHTYWPHQTTTPDPETGQCDPNVAYAYTAQAAEVVVDMETGQVKVENIYCAIDVGKAINPQQVIGQIGWASAVRLDMQLMMENFVEKKGQVLTTNLSTYLVPTVLDIPAKMNIMVLEIPDPRGPWGARGLGEVMNMCLAPAVTAAMYDATGIWFDHFPLVPEEVLSKIADIHKEQ